MEYCKEFNSETFTDSERSTLNITQKSVVLQTFRGGVREHDPFAFKGHI